MRATIAPVPSARSSSPSTGRAAARLRTPTSPGRWCSATAYSMPGTPRLTNAARLAKLAASLEQSAPTAPPADAFLVLGFARDQCRHPSDRLCSPTHRRPRLLVRPRPIRQRAARSAMTRSRCRARDRIGRRSLPRQPDGASLRPRSRAPLDGAVEAAEAPVLSTAAGFSTAPARTAKEAVAALSQCPAPASRSREAAEGVSVLPDHFKPRQ